MKVKTKMLILLILCLASCTKEKVPASIDKKEILNTLIAGNSCVRFNRLIEGPLMEDICSVKQTLDGGYIFCGSSTTLAMNGSDVLLLKTNCKGETEWLKLIPSDYGNSASDIAILSSGDYVLSGNISLQPQNGPIYNFSGQLMRLSSTGELVWRKEYSFSGRTSFNQLVETADGGFLVLGNDDNQGFLLKTDSNGNEIFRTSINASIAFLDLILKPNGNALVCGSFGLSKDIYIAEYTSFGDSLWSKTIDKNNLENAANSILTLSNGDMVLSGYNRISGTELPGFLLRLDSVGNEIWYKSFELEGKGPLGCVVLSQDNQLLSTSDALGKLCILKVNLIDGSIKWEVTKSNSPFIRNLIKCNDNGFMIVGDSFVSSGNRDGYILKIDETGN